MRLTGSTAWPSAVTTLSGNASGCTGGLPRSALTRGDTRERRGGPLTGDWAGQRAPISRRAAVRGQGEFLRRWPWCLNVVPATAERREEVGFPGTAQRRVRNQRSRHPEPCSRCINQPAG